MYCDAHFVVLDRFVAFRCGVAEQPRERAFNAVEVGRVVGAFVLFLEDRGLDGVAVDLPLRA